MSDLGSENPVYAPRGLERGQAQIPQLLEIADVAMKLPRTRKRDKKESIILDREKNKCDFEKLSSIKRQFPEAVEMTRGFSSGRAMNRRRAGQRQNAVNMSKEWCRPWKMITFSPKLVQIS